ncbi:MAG: ATP-grasp domain-containing protein [Ignavibacteriales bacterium]|nr:ATP-grasp domain-containing protein [Ignavibacteriales bacterium]
MATKLHISIVFNEPTIQTAEGRKYLSEWGYPDSYEAARAKGHVDLSEVGVVEEKEDVQSALNELGYETSVFNMSNDVERLLVFIRTTKPDLVFNLVESLGDQAIHEMHVAGIFEVMGIPYTGSAPLSLGTCLNKARTKELLTFHRIPTPRFVICGSMRDVSHIRLPFPLFVKPAKEDASVGIDNSSVVRSPAALRKRIKYILEKFEQPALVEQYIEGRELNVAIIGNRKPVILPISEIDFSGLPEKYPKIVTYSAKWMNGTIEFEGTKGVCPAKLAPAVEKKVRDIALRAYQVMGCRDYARVDIRLARGGNPYVIEVNPNPDISTDSGFIRSSRTHGFSFNEIIGTITGYALERCA